ncbi:MAG: Mur ligase family protein [Sulfurimonas sp.]|nr:Mur ligase family protein [Sulfurimonas sp.]MDQ7059916.1 Mur ligase family protein [Sulfurimonas sp.]
MMFLNSELISKITDGKWFHLDKDIKFHGIRVNIKRLQKNDLCFTTTPEQWGKKIINSELALNKIFDNGASAAVISDEKLVGTIDKPLLVVKDSKKALQKIAFYVRDNVKIPRILVTGTEGKTGYKNQLYTLLSYQTKVHAKLDSSNLNVPIMCSMASLDEDATVEIVEASIAGPNVGVTRSNLVKPNICVITQIGLAHITTHGSIENMIYNKASVIDALEEDGICIVNADSENYDAVREEIYKRKYVDIKTFGSGEKCNARVLESNFNENKLLWNIKATIEGIEVEYQVPLLGDYVPVASLIPLLTIHYLGYDVKKAAADFIHFKSMDTMGGLSEITTKDKKFKFFDHSHRGSMLGYTSALKDFAFMKPQAGAKKIAVIGHMMNIGKISKQAHDDLAALIEDAKVDRVYTVGKFAKRIYDKLENKAILVKHGNKYQDIEEQFLADIEDGDIIFMKGNHRIWLKELAAKIYDMGERDAIR